VNRPVLVLNANYEPLNVCTTRRAMGLLLKEKAVLISNGRGFIRTPSTTFLRPSVIRLGYMVHRPRPRVKLTKHEIFQRDNYTCQYCGRQGVRLTIDHLVPRHRGGEHVWTNLVAACEACNRRKGGRSPHEARMHLLRAPFEPSASPAYLYHRYLEANQDWLTFLEGW
jgi:5-methylcytosine-specific restriction endonuclease McrA